MKILALDTSGLTASVAVAEDGRLVAQYSIQYKTTHSQILMPMMESIRELTGLDLQTIDAIAVAAGPGSFTGLRIGAATAKALCLALKKPLVPIPTVDGLAYNLYGSDAYICPMMDARRGQVYTGIYHFEAVASNKALASETSSKESAEESSHTKKNTSWEIAYEMVIDLPQCALSVEELAEHLNKLTGKVILLGDGAPVYKQKLADLLNIPYSEAPLFQNRQNAATLASLAQQYYQDGKAVDADSFAPEYLRPSQAEREGGSPDGGRKKKLLKEKAKEERVYIREMRPEDLEGAYVLEKANMGAEAWTKQQLLDASMRSDTVYVVAEKGDRIVGLCGVQNISGDGDVTNVSVAQNCRGEGIGRKMLFQLMERGRGIGVVNYTLEVRAGNTPAITLYEHLGFTSDGIRPGFYSSPKEDAVIYWKRKKTDD